MLCAIKWLSSLVLEEFYPFFCPFLGDFYFLFLFLSVTLALSGSVEDLSVLTLDRHETGLTQVAVLSKHESASIVMVISLPNTLADGGGLRPSTYTHMTYTHNQLSDRFLMLSLFLSHLTQTSKTTACTWTQPGSLAVPCANGKCSYRSLFRAWHWCPRTPYLSP